MKKIAFIGGYDKSDIIIYIAKILSVMPKKVLVIDTTLLQKTRYLIPTMTPAAKYVIDNPKYYDSFGLKPEDEHCFLTTFDVYSVQKGLDVLRNIKEQTPILKALVTRDPESEESEYLDFTTFNLKIKWKENIVFMPFETEDLYEIYQNQRYSRVKFTGLSMEYMDSLAFLTENVTGFSRGDVRKAIKLVEREN